MDFINMTVNSISYTIVYQHIAIERHNNYHKRRESKESLW
jgi:hypothetical protein